MKGSEILAHVDHTLLRPTATWKEIKTLGEEARRYRTASVCIPAGYVARFHDAFGASVPICTVIGFPLGYDTTETKISAARQAIADGAEEIDAVVSLTDVKNGDFPKVTAEIAALKNAAEERILKIIVETCYLTEKEKIALCQCVTEGDADFIKTSTGFGTGGATLADVQLIKEVVGDRAKIKASGGIRNRETALQYIDLGVSRIGASAILV